MATNTHLSVDELGLTVIKRRGPGQEADHRAEVTWLRAAKGHPVVPLVSHDPESGTIVTRFTGSTTLATTAPPGGASALAATAAVVGRLHVDQLVHGNLTADHVIIAGRSGRPGRPGSAGPAPMLCSPRCGADPAEDVVALIAVGTGLLDRWISLDGHQPTVLEPLSEVVYSMAEPAAKGAIGALRLARALEAAAGEISRRSLGRGPVWRRRSGPVRFRRMAPLGPWAGPRPRKPERHWDRLPSAR